jgi:hypothetical protein
MNEIITGKGNNRPDDNSRNYIPIELELCADARRAECPYFVGIIVETDNISFEQKFCGWKFRK